MRKTVAFLLSVAISTSAFAGQPTAQNKYSKTPSTKTLIIMGTLIGAGAAMIVAGHKQYPDRPDNNPFTWAGAGLAGGTAVVVGLHYAFKHPPGAAAPAASVSAWPSQRPLLSPRPTDELVDYFRETQGKPHERVDDHSAGPPWLAGSGFRK